MEGLGKWKIRRKRHANDP